MELIAMPRARRTSSSLDFLLMSLLNNAETLSGYDFATILREPVPFIWPVKHSQIYPALAALEARGDMEGEWITQRGRPNKKLYRLTPAGRQRLLDWLREPRTVVGQEEAVAAAYNYRLIGAEAAAITINHYRDQSEREIGQLEERWLLVKDNLPAGAPEAGIHAAYELAIMQRRARIAWCDWLADEVLAPERAEAIPARSR